MANVDNYWQDIRRAAEDVAESVERGEDREEAIDGWAESFTIYTSDALKVLTNTNNDDAVLDVYGHADLLGKDESIGTLYSRIAYFAVRQDIEEELQRLPGYPPMADPNEPTQPDSQGFASTAFERGEKD